MNTPTQYRDIADQLAIIEQHLRAQPLSTDAPSAQEALDALVCAQAVIGQLAVLSQRQDAAAPSAESAP